jgi:hypothetical protein
MRKRDPPKRGINTFLARFGYFRFAPEATVRQASENGSDVPKPACAAAKLAHAGIMRFEFEPDATEARLSLSASDEPSIAATKR